MGCVQLQLLYWCRHADRPRGERDVCEDWEPQESSEPREPGGSD